MARLSSSVGELAISEGHYGLAENLAKTAFEEKPSYATFLLLEKVCLGNPANKVNNTWSKRREEIIANVRQGLGEFRFSVSRRIEFLAKLGSLNEIPKLLTQYDINEQGAVLKDILDNMKENNEPLDRMKEFIDSIMSWLDAVTLGLTFGVCSLWLAIATILPQLAFVKISTLQDQLEVLFDQKTVVITDRKTMVDLLILLRQIYAEASTEEAWNTRFRRLLQGPLKRKSALINAIKHDSELSRRFPAKSTTTK